MKFTIIHGLHPGCGHRKIVAAGRLQTQAAGGAGLFTTVARSEAATVKIPAEEHYTMVLRQCNGQHTPKCSGAKKASVSTSQKSPQSPMPSTRKPENPTQQLTLGSTCTGSCLH